jgi:hypothetical protein
MPLKKIYVYACTIALSLLTTCKKEPINPITGINTTKISLIKISEAYAIGSATKVELWSDSEISTGYQKFSVALYDSITENPITRSIVEILPIVSEKINNTIESSSAPIENPQSFDATETLFKCAAVFTKPTYGDLVQWSITIRLKKIGQNQFTEVKMPINVKQSVYERVKTIIASDGSKLIIAYISPLKPSVGINNFEICLYHMSTPMTFEVDNSYSIYMTTEMPATKEISTNNANPFYDTNGLYRGRVDLTKNGIWRINLNLNKNGKTVSTFFEISL